uniref:Putative integrase/recombinase protein n=1 Tax=Nanofrustulum shiloi TaxID=210602 RepID=A0A650G2W9_9STRA|nr:putative integrase/recombinase protein [Nanofrustulum shiloi]QGW12748.1 putative integrase/recombinase protein [Nanofrustulum shiloi]
MVIFVIVSSKTVGFKIPYYFSEIYNLLMKEIEGPSYIATRTRIAICLLTVTGIRISELLPLKVGQLETLLAEGWISIDRLKRGPANHKAFLTSEGKKIVKSRKIERVSS